MRMTESAILTMQAMSPPAAAQSTKTAEADPADSRPSAGDKLNFRQMLKQKSEQTGQTDQSAQDSKTSAQPAASDGKTDQVRQEIAAALAGLTGSTVQPVLAVQSPAAGQAVSAVNQALPTQAGPGGPQLQANGVVSGLTAAAQASAAPGTVVSTAVTAESRFTQSAAQTQSAIQTGARTAEQSALPAEAKTVQLVQNGGQAGAQENGEANLSQEKRDDGTQTQIGQILSAQTLFHHVEAVPVKVGEPSAVVDAGAQDLDAQLSQQIGTALENGAQHVEIRLTPENLGTVVVNLTRGQDGTLQVVLHTATEKAAELLTQHTGTLGNLLQSSTQSTVQVEVRPQQESQQFQQNGQGRQNGQNAYPQQQHRQQSENFLQQLRLGLVSLEEAAG